MPARASQKTVTITHPSSTEGDFAYRGRELFCEALSLSSIARDYGTPLYVYSLAELLRTAGAFRRAAEPYGDRCLVCYALKANGNPTLLKALAQTGLGADIVSGGELFLATKAGFDPRHVVFSGVGKTRQEISEAISTGVLALHVESQDEQELISRCASELGRVAPVAVRVNPDIVVETHAHVATGQKSHKFGVAPDVALTMMRAAADDPWLQPVGLSAHLGSQIASLEPFRLLAEKLGQMADALSEDGLRLDYIDLGGGLAIDYGDGSGPSVAEWMETASATIIRRGYRLLVEPGRSIIGSAGVLLTRILYTKDQGGRRLLITDAGMTDLIRPALYGARHPILPVVKSVGAGSGSDVVDIVGPVCESTDVLARERSLPGLEPGDLLAILKAGAYGFAMSSNYNGRPRPAEVLVDGDTVRTIRRRESYDTLLAGCDPD